MVTPARTQRAKQPIKASKLTPAKKKAEAKPGPFRIELLDIRFSSIKAQRFVFPEQSKRGRVSHSVTDAKVLFVAEGEHEVTVALFKLEIEGVDHTEEAKPRPSFKVELHVEGLCQHRNLAGASEEDKLAEAERIFDQLYVGAASKAYELVPTIGYKNVRPKLVRPKDFMLKPEMLQVLDKI